MIGLATLAAYAFGIPGGLMMLCSALILFGVVDATRKGWDFEIDYRGRYAVEALLYACVLFGPAYLASKLRARHKARLRSLDESAP